MLVTDLQYNLDDHLLKKLDLMIERCVHPNVKRDAWLVNEGAEGEGKTNTSIAEAYYIKFKTGRDIHLFFRLDKLIEFAKKTDGQIIIWDEPAFDSLKRDYYTKTNQNLIRLMMTARKKRHFIIINMTKFYKFDQQIVVDRALGMVHMYSRKQVQPGRFVYIPQRNLESLYTMYLSRRKKLYKDFSTLRGSFPEVMNKHFNSMGIYVNDVKNATLDDYEKEKDASIEDIGVVETKSKTEIKLEEKQMRLEKMIAGLWGKKYKTQQELADDLGITRNALNNIIIKHRPHAIVDEKSIIEVKKPTILPPEPRINIDYGSIGPNMPVFA